MKLLGMILCISLLLSCTKQSESSSNKIYLETKARKDTVLGGEKYNLKIWLRESQRNELSIIGGQIHSVGHLPLHNDTLEMELTPLCSYERDGQLVDHRGSIRQKEIEFQIRLLNKTSDTLTTTIKQIFYINCK